MFCHADPPRSVPGLVWVIWPFYGGPGHVSEFWAGFWGVPACFVLPIPPHSVPGHDLGNRPALLRHRTICFFSCSFFFVLPTPPSGRGAFWVILPRLVTHYSDFSPFRWYNFASPPLAAVVALLWVFAFPSTRFRPAPPPPSR